MKTIFIERTGSTQDDALAAFINANGQIDDLAATVPVAVVGDFMTAGRGRAGRKWVNPATGNINVSVAFAHLNLVSNGDRVAQTFAPIVIAYSVARCLGLYAHPAFRHKWPNDFLFGERKVGGILIELKDGVFVVGIAFNVFTAPDVDDVKTTSFLDAGFIEGALGDDSRVAASRKMGGDIAAALISDLNHFYLGGGDLTPVIDCWRKACWKQDGDPIMVKFPSGERKDYLFRGINPDGTMLVENIAGGAMESLSYGDVS